MNLEKVRTLAAMAATEAAAEGEEREENEEMERLMGCYGAPVRAVEESAEEILLLWSLRQPEFSKQNALVSHSSQSLSIDACGHHLTILQQPSSMSTPGVTGAVVWDSGIVLGKFLEHAVDSGRLCLQGKRIIELGSGCGLVGCIAGLLGADVILTDLPDRLKLLQKNVQLNVGGGGIRGSAKVSELIWDDDLDPDFTGFSPDIVLGSDVIYSEAAVADLISTLRQLSGSNTTIFLSGELRNDAVLQCFLEAALEEFEVGHIDQSHWHPDYCSQRVALFILVKKSENNAKELY